MKIHRLLQLIRDNARADACKARALRMEARGDVAHIYVYDVIDAWWGASAQALIEALQAADDRDVALHINSPGGDVFEARAMVSAIVAYPGRVVTHIDGLAASAASYLAICGNETRITDGAMLMAHESWTIAWGNKHELAKTGALLDKVDGIIAGDYARKSGKTTDEAKAWMEAETWFTAEEAKESGLVDHIDPGTKNDNGQTEARARAQAWNLQAYSKVPKDLQTSAQPADPDITAAIAEQRQRNQNRLRLAATI